MCHLLRLNHPETLWEKQGLTHLSLNVKLREDNADATYIFDSLEAQAGTYQ